MPSRLTVHASCEKLLALAAPTVLPTLVPIKGEAYDWGFEYDFYAQSSCEEGVLLLITEEMRRLIQAAIPFEHMSMVPQNAAQFLQKKQPIQAEFAAEYPSNVVPLCKVRDFYDICPEELLETTRQIGPFALYELSFLPDSIVRIRGVAFDDKKMLKTYLKQVEQAKEHDPVPLAEKKELISLVDGNAVWHPKGIEYKKRLESLAIRPGFKEMFCIEPLDGAKKLYKPQNDNRFYQQTTRYNDDPEGLFNVETALSTVQYCFCLPQKLEEELISSLQFMKQIVSILGIEYTFVLLLRGKDKEPRLVSALTSLGVPFETSRSNSTQIELHGFDLRGRAWPLSKLTLMYESVPLIECVPVLSYERLMALLLEKGTLEQMKMEENPTLESESRDSSS
ncbi:MAG: hypothetical protein JSR37_08685 [Verrucomicrobia bacterium]|nr:hypothetical protein [Verrucomicrobiota bacterium]MBS0637763.1 hypothetical protein [Verrucomicrobiota bacterium]